MNLSNQLFCRQKALLKSEVGVQWVNLILASEEAHKSGINSKKYCALLMDEMIITNGIVYSVSQQKVYGLAELPAHGINREIYHDFYGMNSDKTNEEDLSKMSYFDDTLKKLSGYSATGLTQVSNLRVSMKCKFFFTYLTYLIPALTFFSFFISKNY